MTLSTSCHHLNGLTLTHDLDLTPENLKNWLEKADLTLDKLKSYLKPPGVLAYERNLLYRNSNLEILVMNWGYNRHCAIHDHAKSWGYIRIIKGSLINTLYQRNQEGFLTQIAENKYSEGQLIFMPKGTIHRMISTCSQTVSVHGYCPPISGMKVFDPIHNLVFTVSDDCGAWFPTEEKQIVKVNNLTVN